MKTTKEQLFDTFCECQDELTIEDITSLFCETINNLEANMTLFNEIKQLIGEDKYKHFINSLILSFFGSLYISAKKNKQEQNKRFDEFQQTFGDEVPCVTIAQYDEDKHYDA